ncbi:Stage II sporulation protein required for processing of pro-sigma-E (SpoIIR) [Candidatus Syntrophocurvum alkaliphilum]|uniref:Stage II sporulation protein required for processing of pro-sigma-E (SpoIIR) n=1 Tax=Candidatus Syntrophocurvum alkaliphilum TaxID=2293317 RepID=A0A6I6D9L7_9FIRM|nr:stage II sporulation protein R [Candidatus Syntrophocurvum alkaliphilum]QGT99147.1 Stage II sporulation protein required for processing of pro-sigma-E (SpoIIR) [Candidatus Syntrophocurvum alkaliphilum]
MRHSLVILFLLAVILALAVPMTVNYYDVEEAFTPDNLIRVQIIANSDNEEDQFIKYQIKDELVKVLSNKLEDAEDVSESEIIIKQNLGTVESITKKVLNLYNKEYDSTVAFSNIEFPTKSYGDFVLPQDEYKALRITLGNGKGTNWWCVLFPPLCFAGDPDKQILENEDTPPFYVVEKLQNIRTPRVTIYDLEE